MKLKKRAAEYPKWNSNGFSEYMPFSYKKSTSFFLCLIGTDIGSRIHTQQKVICSTQSNSQSSESSSKMTTSHYRLTFSRNKRSRDNKYDIDF